MPRLPTSTLLLVPILFSLGCNGVDKPADAYRLGEWVEVFKGNGNWHVVRVPDSKLVPGSIVKITEAEGLSWIDSLESCGVPQALLRAGASGGSDDRLVARGASPKMNFTKQTEFGAEAMVNIAGVKAGPEFGNVNRISLKIGDNGGDALRLIAFQEWVRRNETQFARACVEELAKPDRYLVAESFRISSATYTFYDSTSAKIKLTLPQIGKLVQFEPNVKYAVTPEGDLTIDQDVYVAIRRAVRSGGGFETLGRPATETAGDDLLAKYNQAAQ